MEEYVICKSTGRFTATTMILWQLIQTRKIFVACHSLPLVYNIHWLKQRRTNYNMRYFCCLRPKTKCNHGPDLWKMISTMFLNNPSNLSSKPIHFLHAEGPFGTQRRVASWAPPPSCHDDSAEAQDSFGMSAMIADRSCFADYYCLPIGALLVSLWVRFRARVVSKNKVTTRQE